MSQPGVERLSREFVKFWLGQSVSLLGNQFTLLALPIAAAVTLHATPLEMGVLGAMRFAPALLAGPPAGVWADRARRRPLLVAAQTLSATALVTIPLAALLGVLTLGQLYAVAFVAGVAATFQGVVLPAYVPAIAGRDRLVEANTRLFASMTVANLVGPGLAGAAVQVLTAPIAIGFDAITFVVGAATAAWARVREPAPTPSTRSAVRDAIEGLEWMWTQPLLRAIGLTILINSGGSSITAAVYFLYFVNIAGMTPGQVGLVFAVAGLTSLLGARLSRPLVRRGWLGSVMAVGAMLVVVGQAGALVAAYGPHRLAFPILIGFSAVLGCALMVYNVSQASIRQAVTPDRLLGRAQSAMFVLVSLAAVAGSLAGGAIGQAFGLRAAIAVGTLVVLMSPLPTILSPLRRLREVPALAT